MPHHGRFKRDVDFLPVSNPYQPPAELPDDEAEPEVATPRSDWHDRFMIAMCFALTLICGGIAFTQKSLIFAVIAIAVSFVGATYLENSEAK